MAQKKKTRQVVETEMVDVETGEIKTVSRMEVREYPIETENYVKLFCNCVSRLVGLSQSEANLFHQLIATMGYNNIVCLGGPARQIIAKAANISIKSLESAIKELRERKIIMPIKMDGVVKRGWYIINPDYVAKGNIKQIESLKMMITIEKDGSAYLSIGGQVDGVVTMSKDIPIELQKSIKR